MTCSACLAGRHIRCHANCGCEVCGKPPRPSLQRPQTSIDKKRAQRRGEAQGPRYKKALVGYRTTLNLADLPLIEFYLGCGLSLSEVARRMGTTRDKVRTVRDNAA